MSTNNFMEVSVENEQTPAYNIKVTGLKNGITLQYKDGGTATYLYFNEDGIYTIPAHNANSSWYGFSFNKAFENENVVIQQLLSELIMNYIVVTKEWLAARNILPLSTMRKSKDGTKYLAHEDFFNAFKKPEKESTEELNTPTLESLKLYPHNSTELNELLNSEEWGYENEATNSMDYIQIVSVNNLLEATKSNILNYNITNKEVNNILSMLPKWEDLIGTPLPFKYKLQYNGKAYRTNQAHTPQLDWKPDEVKSLYGLISNHDGTLEDPIPYEHWMIIDKDLYYIENNILYQGLLDAPNGYDADLSSLPTIAKKIEQ